MGFKANNWGKGIDLDQRVPRHGEVPEGYANLKPVERARRSELFNMPFKVMRFILIH